MSIINLNSIVLAMAGPGNSTTTTTTEAGLLGSGLGSSSPSHVAQQTLACQVSAEGSRPQRPYPTPIQPRKVSPPDVGLGLGLPTDVLRTVVRPVSTGLGIYMSDWEVVDDRDPEDEDEEEEVAHVTALPSPPLLPTRRASPFHIAVIIDDDECPPTHPLFTPPPPTETREGGCTYTFSPHLVLPPYMCAPSPSLLPLPFGFGARSVDTTSPSTESEEWESEESGSPHYVTEEELAGAPLFTPFPTPAAEAFHCLPSYLFVSPIPVAPSFTYKGYTEDGMIYETSLYDTQPEWL